MLDCSLCLETFRRIDSLYMRLITLILRLRSQGRTHSARTAVAASWMPVRSCIVLTVLMSEDYDRQVSLYVRRTILFAGAGDSSVKLKAVLDGTLMPKRPADEESASQAATLKVHPIRQRKISLGTRAIRRLSSGTTKLSQRGVAGYPSLVSAVASWCSA